MKIKLAFLSVVALANFASGASISVTNYDGLSTFALVGSSTSMLVTTGTITVGTYTAEPVGIVDYLTNFTAFGSPIAFFGSGAPGYFTGGVTETITPASFFDGKTVYVVLESDGEVAVWKAVSNAAGNTFTADNPIGGPTDLTVLTTTGSLLFGSVENFEVPGFGQQPGIKLAVVPEPSAALLVGLGALGLLRRRRI